MKPIVVVGSINADLVVHTKLIPKRGQTVQGSSFRVFPGGKGANQAVAIAKLGYPVVLIGKVGSDRHGDDLLANLKSAGVDCHAVERSAESSGVALIVTEESGENTIVVVPGANGELSPEDILRHSNLIQSAGMMLLQLEIPLPTVKMSCTVASSSGIPIMLDPAPAAALSDTLLETVTWLTPNETEIGPLLGTGRGIHQQEDARELAEELQDRGAQNVVIKLGARGSYLSTHDGMRATVSAFAVNAIDTTAAGDAYNAALAVGMLRGMAPDIAARYASAAAAISVTRQGAQPSMATGDEVERFLEAVGGTKLNIKS
jgi:ribokinase